MRRFVVLNLLVLLAVGACRPQREIPIFSHVVLVTIDTLRADHLGFEGYPRPTSPFLDRLAHDGYIFRRSVSAMPTTVPAHATLFTSLYPVQHQVLKNGHILDNSAVTLAEILREKGIATAAFVSSSGQFGPSRLNQGFATFDEPASPPESYRPGADTVNAVIGYLEEDGLPERLFLWVHLFDPHTPYDEGNRLAISESERSGLVDLLLSRHPRMLDYYGGDVEEMLGTIERYDGEVRAADEAVERLFENVERMTADARTLWIVTADHGEGLGGHLWHGHGKHLYNEQTRVPLVFYTSSLTLTGEVSDLVEHTDVLPSVLDLLDVERPTSALAFQGRSLVPYLRGSGGGAPRYALSQRRHYGAESKLVEVPPEGANYEAGYTFSIQDQRYKYIHRSEGTDELFDLEEDFYETHNLLGRPEAPPRDYRQMLRSRLGELRREALAEPTSMSQEDLENLRALGYVQ